MIWVAGQGRPTFHRDLDDGGHLVHGNIRNHPAVPNTARDICPPPDGSCTESRRPTVSESKRPEGGPETIGAPFFMVPRLRCGSVGRGRAVVRRS